MSDILKRTVFVGKGTDGFSRIADWCRVITGVGAMMEPYNLNRDKIPASDFNWQDASNRIDEFAGYDPNASIWDDNTIGGPLAPVNGY